MVNTIRNKMRSFIRRIRTLISTVPFLYLPLAQRLSGGEPVSRETEIVIEGFPRSANSYAEAAFRVAQTRDVKIAHHCHAAAQVIAASKWSIPCLVIIREPEEACRSLMMHHPSLFTARDLFKEYIVFHEHILVHRSDFVLVTFEKVTTHFSDVIRAVNDRFGTSFSLPQEDSDEEVFEALDTFSRLRGTVADGTEPYSPLRTDAEKARRSLEKQAAREIIQQQRGTRLHTKANELYQLLLKSADL